VGVFVWVVFGFVGDGFFCFCLGGGSLGVVVGQSPPCPPPPTPTQPTAPPLPPPHPRPKKTPPDPYTHRQPKPTPPQPHPPPPTSHPPPPPAQKDMSSFIPFEKRRADNRRPPVPVLKGGRVVKRRDFRIFHSLGEKKKRRG